MYYLASIFDMTILMKIILFKLRKVFSAKYNNKHPYKNPRFVKLLSYIAFTNLEKIIRPFSLGKSFSAKLKEYVEPECLHKLFSN